MKRVLKTSHSPNALSSLLVCAMLLVKVTGLGLSVNALNQEVLLTSDDQNDDTRVSQKVMSPVNFNRFNLHIFSRNFKGV